MSNFYHTTERLLLKLIPNQLLHSLELRLRRMTAIPYDGTKYHCNICKMSLKQFIHLSRGKLQYPSQEDHIRFHSANGLKER